jgi:type II secretory ATPase GspE/PulE/Tfp pilus assembly ATPase PilB-like protein
MRDLIFGKKKTVEGSGPPPAPPPRPAAVVLPKSNGGAPQVRPGPGGAPNRPVAAQVITPLNSQHPSPVRPNNGVTVAEFSRSETLPVRRATNLDGVADWRGFKDEVVGYDDGSEISAAGRRGKFDALQVRKSQPDVITLDAKDKIIEVIRSYSGEVISREDGTFPMSKDARALCAVLDNGWLIVSKTEPLDPRIEQVREKLRKEGYPYICEYRVEISFIRELYDTQQTKGSRVEIERRRLAAAGPIALQPPQKKFLDLVKKAVSRSWSDLDILVEEHETIIGAREDGVMIQDGAITRSEGQILLNSIFNMGEDVGAGYQPLKAQGGRIPQGGPYPIPTELEAIRLQFNPTANMGRHLVARLFFRQSQVNDNDDVDVLGYTQQQVRELKKIRRHTSGIVFILGPTGSGKSTTMRAALKAQHRESNYTKKLVCFEDPVEVRIERAIQFTLAGVKSQAEREEAMTLVTNAMLRSDPDIIMLGECRDGVAIDMALTAAKSGHIVYTTFHANDAQAGMSRLQKYQISELDLYDPNLMRAFIAQRLVRKLCKECRIEAAEAQVPRSQRDRILAMFEGAPHLVRQTYYANKAGCPHCKSGYKGREVVAEIVAPDYDYMRYLSQGGESRFRALQYWEDNGGISIAEHGMMKLIAGTTDASEFEHVLGALPRIKPERMRVLLEAAAYVQPAEDLIGIV